MPSRVFAAPVHRANKLTASPALTDKENSVPPISADVGHFGEEGFDLDFQFRKHIDNSESGDVFYTLQENDASHMLIPMPGQASANIFRDQLHRHLQPDQVVDEYGDECDITDISNDHLAVLQAKLWIKSYSGRSPKKTMTLQPLRVQVLIASHTAMISRLLEEKYVFIMSDDQHDTCEYMNDLQDKTTQVCKSQMVRMEPLVHWGTVTPTIVSQFALAFRRDGDLMQKPEYKRLVRGLVDAIVPTYCFDCLGYLWSKCSEARDTLRQLQGTIPQPRSRDLDKLARSYAGRPVLKPDITSSGVNAPAVSGSQRSVAEQLKPADAEMYWESSKALPQLDGTSECPHNIRPFDKENESRGSVCVNSDCDCSADEHYGRTTSLPRSNSFIFPLHTTPNSSHEYGSLTAHIRPPSTLKSNWTKVDKGSRKDQKKSMVTTNKYGFRIGTQTTPPRTTERKFGQEIYTNSMIPLIQVKRPPRTRNIMEESSTSQENQPSVRLTKPLESVKKTKDMIKEAKKRTPVHVDQQTSKQKNVRTPISKATASKELELLQPKAQINITAGLRTTPELEPTMRAPSPLKLVVHSAKRLMNSGVLDGVEPVMYEAFQNDRPAPTSKICYCHQPASHGTFKKCETPRVARCMNAECRLRWYHYACLNQSEKGKARWGILLCQHCRNDKHFFEFNEKNIAKLIDFKTEWSKEDIEAGMPGLGGHASVVNPYGLGVDIDLGDKSETAMKKKGTLGGLEKSEYAQSHPYMLKEAYLNPDDYADLRAERANAVIYYIA